MKRFRYHTCDASCDETCGVKKKCMRLMLVPHSASRRHLQGSWGDMTPKLDPCKDQEVCTVHTLLLHYAGSVSLNALLVHFHGACSVMSLMKVLTYASSMYSTGNIWSSLSASTCEIPAKHISTLRLAVLQPSLLLSEGCFNLHSY